MADIAETHRISIFPTEWDVSRSCGHNDARFTFHPFFVRELRPAQILNTLLSMDRPYRITINHHSLPIEQLQQSSFLPCFPRRWSRAACRIRHIGTTVQSVLSPRSGITFWIYLHCCCFTGCMHFWMPSPRTAEHSQPKDIGLWPCHLRQKIGKIGFSFFFFFF